MEQPSEEAQRRQCREGPVLSAYFWVTTPACPRWRGPERSGPFRRRPRPSGTSTSTAGEREPEGRHLLAVPDEQLVADQRRVVPGLALQRREPCELRELVGVRRHQRELALLREHEQHVLVGERDELAVAVASALPLALAVREIDAREQAAVEA